MIITEEKAGIRKRMKNVMEMNHVLVVEDDKEIREGVEIYLKSQGYEVFQAADGAEGLDVIEREDIHLAIVDIMMPVMDGISMVVKLREKYDFPVIFLSAKSEEVDKIMVHVRNIREKIELNPREPKYLKVVWGVGYKIEKQA